MTVDKFVERILAIKTDWDAGVVWYWAHHPKYMTHEIPKKECRKSIVVDDEDGQPQAAQPKMRLISEPCPSLKFIQNWLLEHVLNPACASLLPCVHGCVPGRSTVTNAKPHVGCLWKIHMDLRDFFPTVVVPRVYGLYRKIFKYDSKLAWMLANLACKDGKLPQGAPTSPAIANLIAGAMDRDLLRLISAMGGYYTRYVDDLTFSFRRPMSDKNKQRFIGSVTEIAVRHGFSVNTDKTSIVTRRSRMVVTGVVVNTKTSIPKQFRSNLRAAIHQRRLEIPMADSQEIVDGRLSYIKMVCPTQAATIVRGTQTA